MTLSQLSSKVPFNNADGKRTEELGSGAGIGVFPYLVKSGELMPAWWSPARDKFLRQQVIQSPHLSGAFYNMYAKMGAIPFKIVPKDPSIKQHMKFADMYETALRENSGIKLGWADQYERWLGDHLTTDNGAFFHIIGDGKLDKPLIGMPLGVIHLDSIHCSRTSNYEFPVVYYDPVDGKKYKMHASRVMYRAQMPSPIYRMYGVGLSAASRCFMAAKSLMDIENYKAEKFGSRPPRKLLVGSGITGDQLAEAFAQAEMEMDNLGLKHYSKMVAIGSNDEVDVKPIDLTEAPEGFSEEQSVQIGMFTIAMCLGIDARELWPATASGATKADALLSHMKARGKGPGQIIRIVEDMFNQKYLPGFLQMVFDYQDDEQDKLKADIQEKLALAREKNLKSFVTNPRVERQNMVEDNVISKEQFEDLELEDGRLVSGESVLLLFNSADPEMQELLKLDVSNPLRFTENDPEKMIQKIEAQFEIANAVAYNAGLINQRKKAQQAIAALKRLKEEYETKLQEKKMQEAQEQANAENSVQGSSTSSSQRSGEAESNVASGVPTHNWNNTSNKPRLPNS